MGTAIAVATAGAPSQVQPTAAVAASIPKSALDLSAREDGGAIRLDNEPGNAYGQAAVADSAVLNASGGRVDSEGEQFRQILGVRFFLGSAKQAVAKIKEGGLLVVPAAPALKNLPYDLDYQDALVHADMAITDSSLMVLVWNLLQGDRIPRLSGLRYFKELVRQPELKAKGGCFWVMANPASAEKNVKWLHQRGIAAAAADVYIAPFYGREVADEALLEKLRERPVQHIVITIGGGNQEKLGLYLKRNLGYRPTIHCIGAAIAFLSGDQVHIPELADKLMLGWLFRCASAPTRYLPRYWRARSLFGLILKYRERVPIEE